MSQSSRLIVSTLVSITLVSAAVSHAHDDAQPQSDSAQRTPDAISINVRPRMRSMTCEAHLEVTNPGAHLRLNQVIVMVGPLFDDSYIVIPVHPGGGVESLKWSSLPVNARDTRLGNGIFVIDEVVVTEVGGEHPKPAGHPVILQISELDENGCPLEIDIHGFEHQGAQGQHGGRAHASGGG